MRYFAIESVECNNGFGFGTTLYVSGCQHHCKECFNKQTWDKNKGEEYTRETTRYLIQCISKPFISRLTISGGDPLSLYNRMSVIEICKEIKKAKPSIDIWIYTGYTLEQLFSQSPAFVNDLREVADHLVDGKFEVQYKCEKKPYRGSGNQKVYDLKNCEEILP